MTTGCRPLPTDLSPKNRREQDRDRIIQAATHLRLLDGDPPRQFPLAVQNDAVAYFAEVAPRLIAITPGSLIEIADLRRNHPEDWRDRASVLLQPWSRRMRPTQLTLNIHRETRPAWANKIVHGDCLDLMPTLPDGSVDVVITSPPYAEQRRRDYSGVLEAQYPDWTVEWMRHVKRVLKPTGSVAMIIKAHVRDGAEHPYVLQTRLALLADGWRESGTLAWVKPDAPPLGRVDRPRSAWEPIHWFALSSSPYCRPKAIGHYTDRLGMRKKKGVGRYIHGISADLSPGIARASNVLVVPLAYNDRSPHNHHAAQYPAELAERLIRMLCPVGGIVLDPFTGSGSTAIAARKAGRYFVGFEKERRYADYATGRYRRYARQSGSAVDRRESGE